MKELDFVPIKCNLQKTGGRLHLAHGSWFRDASSLQLKFSTLYCTGTFVYIIFKSLSNIMTELSQNFEQDGNKTECPWENVIILHTIW